MFRERFLQHILENYGKNIGPGDRALAKASYNVYVYTEIKEDICGENKRWVAKGWYDRRMVTADGNRTHAHLIEVDYHLICHDILWTHHSSWSIRLDLETCRRRY